MLTGKPPLGDLEPVAAMFKIGVAPLEKLALPENVSEDACDFILDVLAWLVLSKLKSWLFS